MPPVTSPGSQPRNSSADHLRANHLRTLSRIRFRRALTLMVMTLLLPGSAQIATGNKRVGRIALRVCLGTLGVGVFFFLVGLIFNNFVFWLMSSKGMLAAIRFYLMLLAVGWALLFMDAWRLGNPLGLRQKQRLAMVGINGFLCFSVAGTLLFASHVVAVQKDFISTMFTGGKVTEATDGRYNVLLLGGDSGADRWGMRPDSITVASIDADTGKTVLFGLPRNMTSFKFARGSVMAEQFPKGYDCGPQCELNSLTTWADDHKDLFKKYDDPGIEATTEAVEGITGLKINYYTMVNLAGFEKLVDAVGGVTLNVRAPIPIGRIGDIKGYVKPGKRKLSGFETLWFARSRAAADDYSRMARQKCVINAIAHQVSPRTAVMKFEDIAKASEATVRTNVPGSEVDRFMSLALKARSQPIATVSFVPPVINTSKPDLDKIHRMVQDAIDPPAKDKKVTRKPVAKKPASGSVGGSLGNIHDGYSANESEDLAAAC